MGVYSYSRSSEIEVLESGAAFETLLHNEFQQLRTFARSHGVDCEERVEDRGAPWSLDFGARPAAAGLLERLRPGDRIFVHSLLRIFSTCADMDRVVRLLRRQRVALYVADLGGDICDERLQLPFARVLRAFSRLEKRRSTERIKAVKLNQRRKGRFLGGSRPFGYMIHSNGRLIENPMEQRVLRRIIEMKNQGMSLRTISSEVSTPVMPISFKTVQRLIKRHEAGELGWQGRAVESTLQE